MRKQISHFIGNSIADYEDYCNAVGYCNISDRVILDQEDDYSDKNDDQELIDDSRQAEIWENNLIEEAWGYNDK